MRLYPALNFSSRRKLKSHVYGNLKRKTSDSRREFLRIENKNCPGQFLRMKLVWNNLLLSKRNNKQKATIKSRGTNLLLPFGINVILNLSVITACVSRSTSHNSYNNYLWLAVQQVSGYLPRGPLLDHLKRCEIITHLMILWWMLNSFFFPNFCIDVYCNV